MLWEMNLSAAANSRSTCWDPSTGDFSVGNGPPATDTEYFSPQQFVAAWMHIRQIFATNGATNVTFLWNPSVDNLVNHKAQSLKPYYPTGDTSPFLLGIDMYEANAATFWNNFGGQSTDYKN